MTAAQSRFKHKFDRDVRPTIFIVHGQEAFFDLATKQTQSSAVWMEKEPRTKLLDSSTGPVRVRVVIEDTVTTLEGGVAISINRVPVVPDAVEIGTSDADVHETTRNVGENADILGVHQTP